MDTVGFIGVGKIGLPVCENLIKSGYKVLGYRRGSLADFEKAGGTPAKSPAEIGKQCNVVFSCVPTAEAMDEVVNGANGLIHSARPGQIIVELGSHPVPAKEKQVAPLAKKGAAYLDGEVSGTPGMVAARKAVIYLGGDAEAAKKVEPVIKGFADLCLYFGPFGAATKVKLVNNLLVALHIAGTAQAMAIGLKTGVDPGLLIKAVAQGSGGSTQFAIRAPWMAERRFMPQQGAAAVLGHYLEGCKALAHEVGVPTPLLDCLVDVYERATPGIGDRDVAAIIEFFEAGSPAISKQASQQEHTT
jgi:3-hydroxyisobutyrate dehydrogenase